MGKFSVDDLAGFNAQVKAHAEKPACPECARELLRIHNISFIDDLQIPTVEMNEQAARYVDFADHMIDDVSSVQEFGISIPTYVCCHCGHRFDEAYTPPKYLTTRVEKDMSLAITVANMEIEEYLRQFCKLDDNTLMEIKEKCRFRNRYPGEPEYAYKHDLFNHFIVIETAFKDSVSKTFGNDLGNYVSRLLPFGKIVEIANQIEQQHIQITGEDNE